MSLGGVVLKQNNVRYKQEGGVQANRTLTGVQERGGTNKFQNDTVFENRRQGRSRGGQGSCQVVEGFVVSKKRLPEGLKSGVLAEGSVRCHTATPRKMAATEQSLQNLSPCGVSAFQTEQKSRGGGPCNSRQLRQHKNKATETHEKYSTK